MKQHVRWAVVVGLVATVALPLSKVADAAQPFRMVATSPVTGVTYTATWSCAAGQVKIAALHTSDTPVTMQMQIRPLSSSWLIRELNRAGSFAFTAGGDARDDNDQDAVEIRDGFKNSGTSTLVMLMQVPDCPDYSVGTRSVFQGIQPERVLDTRPAFSVNYSGAKPGPGAIITLPGAWFPDMPDDATAVSISVTGTDASGPGFLQAYPTGAAEPGSSSNVNLPFAGATVANLAVVPVGSDGSISLLTSGGAHLIVDVNGYFVPTTTAVAAGRLETVSPQKRMLDTRPESAVNYSGAKPNDSVLTIDLTADDSGLPDGATAAIVNITATGSDGAGFVQTDAGGALVKGASSVLNLTGPFQTVAGLSITPLSEEGTIDVYASGSTHLIVDLIGWFTGATSEASTAGLFVPLPPERIYDSRLESMVNAQTGWDAGGIRSSDVYLAALNGLMGAIFVNGTATGNVGPGYVVLGPRSVNPPTSSMNMATPNATVANAAVVRATLGFDILSSTQSHVIVDLAGYFTLATA